MVQSLIQRIRENKLDALYLFINESLRDRNEFDAFFHNLVVVLPNNWSINRVEIGHEFLSRTVVGDQQHAGGAQGINNNETNEINGSTESKQDQLFRWICSLESLRSLIISDGYIPRKDHGFVDTKALLRHLPRANNLQYLDIQRLKLRITGDGVENNDADLLAVSLHSLRDSLEDLRLTAISMCDTTINKTQDANTTEEEQHQSLEQHKKRHPLDATIRVCGEMANLQLLAISSANGCDCHSDNGEDQHNSDDSENRNVIIREAGNETDNKFTTTASATTCLISKEVLLRLCRSSSTLQELALRSMRIDDDTCKTIAKVFDPPVHANGSRKYLKTSSSTLSLQCSESEQENDGDLDDDSTDMDGSINQHSPSFWTSLDLRRNPSIGTDGYEAILSSLERNYDLWCSLMVDNDSFQSRFNALIDLNQANRGSLVRSPTPEKLALFMDRLKDDPTALWYFLTIHRDSILHPLIRFLQWKNGIQRKRDVNPESNRTIVGNQDDWRGKQQQQAFGQKRTAAEVLSLQPFSMSALQNHTNTTLTNGVFVNTEGLQPRGGEASAQRQHSQTKRLRQSTEGTE